MKEIKFRVWEPLNEQMHYLDFCLYEDEGGIKKFTLPTNKQGGLKNSYTVMNLDSVIIEQYTGLKDRNGTEIYEGDIVLSYGNVFKAVVSFESGTFQPFNSSDNCSFHADKCVIIGNMHDNPELLNK